MIIKIGMWQNIIPLQSTTFIWNVFQYGEYLTREKQNMLRKLSHRRKEENVNILRKEELWEERDRDGEAELPDWPK